MNQETQTNKQRFGLYNLALIRIEECKNSKDIIPFPKIFQKLCRSFSISKKEAWEVLFILRDFGFIEIVPYHGIVLKNG